MNAYDWRDPSAPCWADVPPLYSQEGEADPIVRLKLFDTAGRFTLYVTEAGVSGENGRFTLFGFVVSALGPDCDEIGYADHGELADVRNRLGLHLERDLYFGERRLSEVRTQGAIS